MRGAQETQHSMPEQEARTRGQKAGTAGSQWRVHLCVRTYICAAAVTGPAGICRSSDTFNSLNKSKTEPGGRDALCSL